MPEGIRLRNGRYQARVSWYVGDKRREAVKTFATLAEARAWRTARLKELGDSGEVFETSSKPLGEYLTEWLDASEARLRPATLEVYRHMIRNHLEPKLGDVPLNRLTPAKIQAFYRERGQAGVGSRSILYLHQTLHKALGAAVRLGYLRENPTDRVERPGHTPSERRPLTQEELARLLEAAEGHPLEALFLLAATTGLRRGELLALRWKDVDLDNAVVVVARQLTEVAGRKMFGDLKTKASRRVVPLLPVAVEALRQHRKRQLEERMAAGPYWQDEDLVFTTHLGGPLQPNNITRRTFPDLLKKAGIDREGVSFHSLRHTTATMLLMGGAGVKDVQGILGHARADMTVNRYAHIVEESKRQAVEKAADLLAPRTKRAR